MRARDRQGPCTLTAAAVTVFACLASAADAQPVNATPQSAQCDLVLKDSLDMKTEPDGLVTVPVRVNGREVAFFVDTGGYYGGISASLAGALKLPERTWLENQEFVFYDRAATTQIDEIDMFELGRLSAKSVPIPVIWDQLLTGDTYGLLGGNVLNRYDLDIDFVHEKLNLFSPDHCPGRVVYWADSWSQVPITVKDGWHVVIPVTLDGKTIQATVDTGAAQTVMTVEHAQDLFGWPDKSALKSGAHGEVYYPFSSLKFGGIEVLYPSVALLPKSSVTAGAPELLLGANVLRQLHLYIAYKEKMLYLTPAEAH